jgi:hypothetical protein
MEREPELMCDHGVIVCALCVRRAGAQSKGGGCHGGAPQLIQGR